MEDRSSPMERAGVQHAMRRAQVGAPDTVRRGIEAFLKETGVDELMVAGQIFDHQARLRSFEIVSEIHAAMSKDALAASAA
jgi:alkanesulfonate monooxygenase SsuD/methylene tetrahydromethanopterin reductase-like flavin-dependent oxidoreductase (luciferase family)